MDIVNEMAEQQEEMGAHILDINMGMNGIDEKEMMLKAIEEVTLTTSLPLCIDSSHVDIIEAALRHYPGRALINLFHWKKKNLTNCFRLRKNTEQCLSCFRYLTKDFRKIWMRRRKLFIRS